MSGFKTQPAVMMCGMNVAGINEVDQRGRWHLSYNPSVQGYGCVTTALVFDNRVFFVLEGDHRKTWGEVTDLAGALDYFIEHHQQISDMSEHRMALGLARDEFALMPTLADIAGPELFTKLFNAFKAGAEDESN